MCKREREKRVRFRAPPSWSCRAKGTPHPPTEAAVCRTSASKPGLSFRWCKHMLSLHKSSGSIQNIGVSSLPEELLWEPKASKGTRYLVLKDTSLGSGGSEIQLHPMQL